MRINRGDVVLVLFPDSNLLTAKRRPALVVQADSVIMTDNLATVRYDEIDRAIGCLTDLTAIDIALRHTLGM